MPPDWTDEEWWKEFPSDAMGAYFRHKCWERRSLDVIGNIVPGEIVDAVGLTNNRGIAGTPNCQAMFRWDPINYHSYKFFEDNPFAGEGLELRPDQYIETGLEFYVYICMENVYVTYDKIRNNDKFFLTIPKACELNGAQTLICTIKDEPPHSYQKKHQIVSPWSQRHWLSPFPLLTIPIFLRLEPEEIQKVLNVFSENEITTISYELRYTYPKEKQNEWSSYHPYVIVMDTDDFVSPRKPRFFTFGRERKYINFLSASDIHVAERNDTIESKAIEWGIELPPRGNFCNFNNQAQRLADKALDYWRNGKIDYVFLIGDLIDFSLKDSKVQNRIDFIPTAKFAHEPKPFGMGEHAFNIFGALSEDFGSHSGFDTPNNFDRINNIIDKMWNFENTNWHTFNEIFKDMMTCVPTYLVPGNHDYIVFGSELAGISEPHFNEFFDTVIELAEDEGLSQDVIGPIIQDAVIAFLEKGTPRPGYESLATFQNMGLTEAQAEKYDLTRSLECGDDDGYRALLGAFWGESALRTISTIPFLSPNAITCVRDTSFRIKMDFGNLRFACFNSGPSWNMLVNPSPWLRGFPDPVSRKGDEINESIIQIEKWRKQKNDMLVIFMHSPPLNRIFPHIGPYKEFCFRFTKEYGEWLESHQWPSSPCEFTNIWKVNALRNHSINLAKDRFWGSPFHNHKRLLMALSPETFNGCHPHIDEDSHLESLEEIESKEQPVLTISGHTHWRHAYSLKKTINGGCYERSQGCTHFLQGNSLIDELNESADLVNWWKKRSMIVTTGCVGPIPPGEMKIDDDGSLKKLEYGDEGYIGPDKRQGYYIIRVDSELGVVDKIEWQEMYFKTED